MPVKKSEQRKIVEYALALDVKRKRGEFADFLRAITPLLVELFVNVLKNCFEIDLSPFTETEKGEFKWNGTKISENIEQTLKDGNIDLYKNSFKPSVTSFHLYTIMKNLPSKNDNMRKAFEIIEKIKKLTKLSSSEIMSRIKKLFNYSDISVSKEKGWNSYELMNDSIIAKISQK